MVGGRRQHVLDVAPGGQLVEVAAFDTADGLYDCAWSEDNENILVSASGDGSVKVWDLQAPPQMNPLRSFKEHSHEVYCVDWNLARRDCFLSASWDDTIKLWDLQHPGSVRTFAEHTYCVYQTAWSPVQGDIFASASGDCTVKLWDLRLPNSTCTFRAHDFEVLALDWNKYNDFVVATGSVDKSIRIWDIRNPNMPMATLFGHTYAVRRVVFSPHRQDILASCSYDMSACLWNYQAPEGNALLQRYNHHTEFTVGLDLSVLQEGVMATTGWDEMVYSWREGMDPRA